MFFSNFSVFFGVFLNGRLLWCPNLMENEGNSVLAGNFFSFFFGSIFLDFVK